MTPLVRKLANDNNVDLSTSPAPASVDASVSRMCWPPPRPRRLRPQLRRPLPPLPRPRQHGNAGVRPELAHLRGTTQKANRIRQITATKTRESLQTTAQLTQTFEVDVTKIVALRARQRPASSSVKAST